MPSFYRPVAREVEVFRAAHRERLPVLLKGPTGCGKSRFVEFMAESLARPLITVACNDETSAADLVGRWLVRGGDTVWQDGPATRAVKEGALLYLDEIAEAREDVVVLLHPLTDHRRQLFLDRSAEVLSAPPDFMLVASFNPGYRRGLKELKPSTRQRFVTLDFGYPPESVELEVLEGETGIDAKLAKRLVAWAAKVRAQDSLALSETVSTRLLVMAARLMVAGLPPRLACRVTLVQPLTDDAPTAQALGDLVDLSF
ncbi:MAG: CbbQ/NirQ/NorQ/GpvN family protein [Sorangiineae bacterium]|nr:CbbQ/NirQ/NorQ/GpvN family protein [Polyangiaceae bacterium]MEB2324463.1 CbbQ/NirQ/NorQ/GpvN family protein [Sorangiineae bacterium]